MATREQREESEGAGAAREERRSAATGRAGRLEFVRKRDGRLVPFQRQKIADAVRRATEAAGEPDARFAAEVAGIVELALRERLPAGGGMAAEGAPPHIETIQDLVERALVELGRAAVAKAYILHRDLRARMRSALRVHRSDTLRAPVRVREREGVSDWSKGRIVAALMDEAELPREAAEDVASTVERRLFAAGKRTVTTGLVRELVASELFERGWLAALQAARIVGLPRPDVRRILAGQEPRPAVAPGGGPGARLPIPAALSAELLARYGLESVLSDPAGELHRSGDVHVVGLESLGRPLALAVETELLLGGGQAARAAYDVLDELAELAPRVARVIVLERPGALLAALLRGTRDNSPHGLSAWLRALAALAHGARLRIDLGTPGARATTSTARLVEELSELEGPFAPRLYLEGAELEQLLAERPDLAALVERGLASERLVPCWNGPESTFAGPGCERLGEERGILSCSAAVALNLPRIARRAGPFREEPFQSALAELVSAAVEIAGSLRGVQETRLASGMRARDAVAIVPVGLREALWVLGDGAIDPELGARTLGFLGEAARRFGHGGRLARVACPFFGEEAAARFALLDARAQRAAGRQEWLFDVAEADVGEVRPYSHGFGLAPVPGMAAGRAEAELLRTVPCGALALGAVARRAGDAERPALDAWRRFEVVRRAHSGELVLELFPHPRPERVPRPRPLV